MPRRSRPASRVHVRASTDDDAVAPIELFFDLVFVFAITQITSTTAHDLTGMGLARGMLLLGLLWWSWVGYAWLGNVVRAHDGAARLAMFVAMLPMFVLAISIPEAFHDKEGGLPGPVVITACYFLFRLLHLVLFWIVGKDDPGLRRQLARFAPSMLGASAGLLVASQAHGGAQVALWAIALLADYLGTYLGGASGWRIKSSSHFVERHGLILLIALGESIVAIGAGAGDVPISWPIVGASTLGLLLIGALWWSYFDTTAHHGEHAMGECLEHERARLARDVYSFLHFPIVAGVVLLALGLKKVLAHVSDVHLHHLSDPLHGAGLLALYGGVALYFAAQIGFTLRTVRSLDRVRLATVAVVAAAVPLASALPALVALGLLAAISIASVVADRVASPAQP